MSSATVQRPFETIDADAILRALSEGTATATGQRFFRALVENLGRTLGTDAAWVTEYIPSRRVLRGLAFWANGQWIDDYETRIDGTPCEAVVSNREMLHIPDRIVELYPNEPDIEALGACSYLGVPFLDRDGNVLGHLAVMDKRPLPPDPRLLAVFNIFAARAGAEFHRLAAEARVREREQKLAGLINGAMDAVVDLDAADLRVAMVNPAAERVFAANAQALVGKPVAELLGSSANATLADLARRITEGEAGGSIWVPEPFEARRGDGSTFIAEATLSRYQANGRTFLSLILRDVGDRLRAEQAIRSLTAQRQYLEEELAELHNSGQILGCSAGIRHVLRDIEQVAGTDATVLVLGETGTGKELIARAIHTASKRRDKPLIRVNCAAIPAALMESEFFGHEKGAFTGATQRRDGRFLLADGGTLFLDEVGELPLDLQVKLLRVLQEGEFEPVGGNRTISVNVRVVAATNRDLEQAIRVGRFREDLYYRLNVFPIRVPPLRERGDDVAVLSRAFAARAADRTGRRVAPLTDACIRRLQGYAWPGNVRELQNVIERAVITSIDGRLNLDRALPEVADKPAAPPPASHADTATIRTLDEMEAFERDNIRRALEATQWRISGDNGAAALLAINPSTLRSRMKALGIKKG